MWIYARNTIRLLLALVIPVENCAPSRLQRVGGIDQDESDTAWLAAAVDPGVVRSLLDQDVALPKVNLLLVELHVDLAREHDGIVDRARPVYEGMRRRPIFARSMIVVRNLLLHEIRVQPGDLRVRRRREIDDAEHRAAPRRGNSDLHGGAVGTAGHVGRALIRHPQQPCHGTTAGTDVLVWVGAVEQHDGFPGVIVAGDDAADFALLHASLPSAADLQFLRRLPQARLGTSNRKAALETYTCQCPFASEVRVRSVLPCITNFGSRALPSAAVRYAMDRITLTSPRRGDARLKDPVNCELRQPGMWATQACSRCDCRCGGYPTHSHDCVCA